MNYYKFNIGDYAAATRHLSMIEHGAYRLLLDLYYTTEQPIPADLKAAARKAGARSKDEVAAVEVVLTEFFTLTDAGWEHARCKAEIAEYMEGSDEREKKEANEKERMRRHRERRSEMFAALRLVGIVPAWDVSMKDLQRLYDDTCNTPETHLKRVAGVAPETPATAKPLTTNQEPITNNQSPPYPHPGEREPESQSPPEAREHTPQGLVTKAMRKAGIADANPSHPKLTALLKAGADQGVFVAAANEATQRGKGFAYALAIVEKQLQEAVSVSKLGRVDMRQAEPINPRLAGAI